MRLKGSLHYQVIVAWCWSTTMLTCYTSEWEHSLILPQDENIYRLLIVKTELQKGRLAEGRRVGYCDDVWRSLFCETLCRDGWLLVAARLRPRCGKCSTKDTTLLPPWKLYKLCMTVDTIRRSLNRQFSLCALMSALTLEWIGKCSLHVCEWNSSEDGRYCTGQCGLEDLVQSLRSQAGCLISA